MNVCASCGVCMCSKNSMCSMNSMYKLLGDWMLALDVGCWHWSLLESVVVVGIGGLLSGIY